MGNAIRAEFRKFFTTRLWWGMAIGIFVSGAGLAAVFALLGGKSPGDQGGLPALDSEDAMNTVYTAGISFAYLMTLCIGVLSIGSEYRHKTITATFLGVPHRAQVMGAKIVSTALVGAFYGVIFLIGSVGIGAPIASARGFSPFPHDQGIPTTLMMALVALALWALIGLGVGILITNQVAALLIAVGIAWIGEFLIILAFNGLGWDTATGYLPGQATGAMLSQATQDGGPVTVVQLSRWGAAAVLTGYALLLAGLGALRTSKADIS